MENIVINLMASIGLIVSTGLLGSILVVLPDTGLLPKPEPKKYKFVQVSRTLVKKIQEKEWTDPGYEKGVFNTPAILARFNPHLNATQDEIDAWNEVTFEEPAFEHISINCEETVEIEESTLSLNVMDDEADHPDTCDCFVCCPFGVNSMGSKISKVKANTQALLSDLDTIGNPDRADAFYSYGVTDALLKKLEDERIAFEKEFYGPLKNWKIVESDLPSDFYEDDNLAQDWFDNQLYV